MRTLRTVAELRDALAAPRRERRTIGLVPTMGAFHDGHRALMLRARERCDQVVVSLFVNPTQFDQSSDLAAYPSDEAHDARVAAGIGIDYLFAPSVQEIYPAGFATAVSVAGVAEALEGTHRGRRHFDAVATVVTKLFNIVTPDVAYFGQKDAQQAIVIRQLVRDLDMPVRIEVCPTVREQDGLAMSSRNARLDAGERERATSLHRALLAAQAAVTAGDRDAGTVITVARNELSAAAVEPDYVELVRPENLAPVTRIDGDVLAMIAARVGSTRLIDNQIIRSPGPAAGGPETDGRA